NLMISPWGFSIGGRNVFISLDAQETTLVYLVSPSRKTFKQNFNQLGQAQQTFAISCVNLQMICRVVPGPPLNPPSLITMRNGASLCTMIGYSSSFSSWKARRLG